MRQLFTLIFLLVVAVLPAHADLRVFATVPEWGALVREIGGDKVQVYVATSALQDPHRIEHHDKCGIERADRGSRETLRRSCASRYWFWSHDHNGGHGCHRDLGNDVKLHEYGSSCDMRYGGRSGIAGISWIHAREI